MIIMTMMQDRDDDHDNASDDHHKLHSYSKNDHDQNYCDNYEYDDHVGDHDN